MKIETVNIDNKEITVLTADEGKLIRRIGDPSVSWSKLYLGYSYYINGQLQDPPHLDTVEDFEEIDYCEDETEIDNDQILEILLGHDA